MRKRTAFDLMMEKCGFEYGSDASLSSRVKEAGTRLASGCGDFPFVVEQMREEFPDIARRIEMPGHAPGAAADREREAVEVGHDRKHAFIGDVVADEERA